MKSASRFKSTSKRQPTLRFTFDGEVVAARPGDTVAAAILAHSGWPTRLTAKDAPRTPYCMMGVCFECLVEIDGRPNVQGCMVPVHDGMCVRRQAGLRTLAAGDADV